MQKYTLSSLLPTHFPPVLLISFISFIILFIGCSGSENADGTSFVTGEIQMVNNEPFAVLAVVNDTTVYLIDCPDEIRELLYNNQGRSAKIYYNSIHKNEEGLKVLKALNVELSE
jgi:hypothetical protein